MSKLAESLPTTDPAVAKTALDRIAAKLSTIEFAEVKDRPLMVMAQMRARLGDFEGAMKAAREIGEGPKRPNSDLRDGKSYAMSLVARQLRSVGKRDQAKQVLREALDSAKTLEETRGKSIRLEMVAEGMLTVDDLAGALLCVENMKIGQRSEILQRIADKQRSQRDDAAARASIAKAVEDATSTVDTTDSLGMRKTDSKLSAERAAITSRIVAITQAAAGDFATARKTADAIQDPFWRNSALVSVAKAQAASGDAAGALVWVRELKDLANIDLTISPLQALIEGAAEANDPKPAGPPTELMIGAPLPSIRYVPGSEIPGPLPK